MAPIRRWPNRPTPAAPFADLVWQDR